MQFRCPDCGYEYTGSEKMIGGRARCAECRNAFVVTPHVEETAVANPPAVEFVEDEPFETKWKPRAAGAKEDGRGNDSSGTEPIDTLSEPVVPMDRHRFLRRYLASSLWALRIVSVASVVAGVVMLYNAHATYRQIQELDVLGGLKNLGGFGELPFGGLGGLSEMAAPSPWTFYALPIVTIVGSILMYLMGMLVIHVVRIILDMEENTRRLVEKLERSERQAT